MSKQLKLLLALTELLSYGSSITEIENGKKYIVRGDSSLYSSIEEEDMILSQDEIIELAELYCGLDIVKIN